MDTFAGSVANELDEMVNLPRKDTGLDGTVCVSTAQDQHAPWVKWYPERVSRDQPCVSVTLEAQHRFINHGSPERVDAQAVPPLRAWVHEHRPALLGFWHGGLSWTRDEMNAFVDGSRRLP